MGSYLFVHNDVEFYTGIVKSLQEKGHETASAEDCRSAASLFENRIFDAVVFDSSIKDCTAPTFSHSVRNAGVNSVVILALDREAADEIIRTIESETFDFLQKPFTVAELELKIQRGLRIRSLKQEADSLRGERNIIYKTENFIGESFAIKKVFEIVDKVSQSNSTVLLTGETGTGKELIAGAIHYNSLRADHAFVKVNCAALPEQLLESELFGHEKGAFTGADRQRIGRFEQAHAGSIFLDEIGDMSLATQAKVLRVLQEKEFERVGSSKTLSVDVRVIAATNKDLQKEIQEGNFREDLYYRLNVVTIFIPPLRERRGDITLLSYFFLKKFCADLKKSSKELHPIALKHLQEYGWPGNIRELENTIERAVLMSNGGMIKTEDLGLPIASDEMKLEHNPIKIPPGGVDLEEVEKELILQALRMTEWVQKDASKLLGISNRVLNYKIKKHGITNPGWKRFKGQNS